MARAASLTWPISRFLSISAGYTRTHQWVQSLRNPETPIAFLFSPDLSVAIGADGIPVARADQLTVSVSTTPLPGVRAELQSYVRDLDGLTLVAPSTGQPFAVSEFAVGGSRITGAGVRLELDRARYRGLLDYGVSSVENEAPGTEYRPGFAVSHWLTAGVLYHPAAEWQLRTSLRAEFGRPTTLIEGPFGWEACALIDGGCEAESSPDRRAGALSGDRLPAYLRLDLGVRKHWHPRIAGRDGVLVVFATVSNVLGRDNLLAYVSDPKTGELAALPMRPFTPLTAGLEWRF